ncbi:hypothetical protein DXH78_13845 [Undibacter mobilis]|uniref:CdiI immunity protein domain-containing protein n=1 Tax=Undibacter mobilis TaxID=2292256 RepID=A0A371BDX4_9BRAD|nr:hypothetical protein DXH78_13845 [Undibacter mobilis]
MYGYLAGQFADADLAGQTDEQAAVNGLTPETRAAYEDVLQQGRTALASASFDWTKIADFANRRFGNEGQARRWLTRMMDVLEKALRNS